MIRCIWPVAVGLAMEFYAILNVVLTRQWNGFIDRMGLLLVTAGVAGELVVEYKAHGAERRLRRVNAEIEREAETQLKAADERIAGLDLERARIEGKLLRTLGPRQIDDEKRARMSAMVRELLPDSTFLIFLCPQKNNEDQRETSDFAWQLAEIFNAPVCSVNQQIDWDIDDIWIRPSVLDPENVRVATARAIFALLKREDFNVHCPIPISLPDQHVFRLERGTAGMRVGSFVTPEEFNGALCVAIGKKSQPVFRLDD